MQVYCYTSTAKSSEDESKDCNCRRGVSFKMETATEPLGNDCKCIATQALQRAPKTNLRTAIAEEGVLKIETDISSVRQEFSKSRRLLSRSVRSQ
jgi:hypothetical protein